MLGGDQNDTLIGTDGADIIYGNDGDDYIVAGAGKDFNVSGGAGADVIAFGLGDEVIKVLDWEDGVDKIDLLDGLSFADLRLSEYVTASGARSVSVFTPNGDRLIFSNIGDAVIDANDFLGAVPPPPSEPIDIPSQPPTQPPAPGSGQGGIRGGDQDDTLIGTDGADVIYGTGGNDYIVAGAGKDFNVSGGAGADFFAFGFGDEVIKVLDWEDGVDKIDLLDGLSFADLRLSEYVTASGARSVSVFTPNGDRLIFSNIGDAVIDANDFLGAAPPPPPPPPLPTDKLYLPVLASGQSLMFGTASTLVTHSEIEGGWMVDWDDVRRPAEGPGIGSLADMNSHGLRPYENENFEVEGAGLIIAIRENLPDLQVAFGSVAVGGQSLLALSTGTLLENALVQIDTMIAEILAVGQLTEQFIFRWEQGQGDTSTPVDEYKTRFLEFVDLLDARADAAAGFDMDFQVVITQVRSYAQGRVAQAQLELALENEHIILEGYEAEYQFNNPASETDFTHLSGQGQFDKGYAAGGLIAEWLITDAPPETVFVESVTVDGVTLIVDFANVRGNLFIGDFYNHPSSDAPSLDNLGAGVFTKTSYYASGMPTIIGWEILDVNTVIFQMDSELKGSAVFATAREHGDNTHGSWLSDESGMIPFQYVDIFV